MKKIFSLILAAFLFLNIFCSCKNKETTFTAYIDEAGFYNNRISVYTVDDTVDFDAADVTFTSGSFKPKSFGIVKITYSKINTKETIPKITASKVEYLKNAKYRTILKEEYEKLNKDDFVLIDVRSTDIYKKMGHLQNAINISAKKINPKIKTKFLPDLNKKIVVYGSSDKNSKIASLFLLTLGYTNVYDLGGIEGKDYKLII